MSALQIEAGKHYRTRDGRKVGPIEKFELSGGAGVRWKSSHRAQSGYWFSDGSWDLFDNPLDLVAEWQEEPAADEPDLHAQLLDAERRCEAMHDAASESLRALCETAGVPLPAGKRLEFPVLFKILNGWIEERAKRPDPQYASILVPAAKVESLSFALSDLACWARGFRAALPRNDFGVPHDDAPIGTWALTELNIALKRALEKTA